MLGGIGKCITRKYKELKMSSSKAQLSITKRVLLDFVKFKTNNNFKFFGGNEYIASVLDLTKNTAKTFVNDLIREGYLYKETDKKGRRLLSLTGKEYKPLFEDLTNLDKKALREENNDLKQDNKYLEQELETHKHHANMLLSEKTDLIISNTELNIKIQELEERIAKLENRTTKLENLFYKNGISQEQLEKAIQENEKKD